MRAPEFVSGETFNYLGRGYRLKVVEEAAEMLCFDGKNFILHATARSKAADHFMRWYIQSGRPWILERVNLLNRKIGAMPARVDVRDLGYRWGSCGQNGAVNFNWKLVQLPLRVIDYVIAHELAHLIEPNHGAEFWRILDRSMPDWRLRMEELNAKASHVYWLRR
jgi:predicted metal-dependent hydrolase